MAATIRAGNCTYNLDHIRRIEMLDDSGGSVLITYSNGDVECIEGEAGIEFDAALMVHQMHYESVVGAEFRNEVLRVNAESRRTRQMDTPRQHSPDEIPPDAPEYINKLPCLSINVLGYDGQDFSIVWHGRGQRSRGWFAANDEFDADGLKAWWYLPEYKDN